jgi:hypothetical protein
MKKEDVIKNQKCGIKWYKHVESHVGKQSLIDTTIDIHLEMPNIWDSGGKPWNNIHWAFGNAFRNEYDKMKVKIRNNDRSSFNLDEVLEPSDIEYIKTKCNISLPYKDSWERN